MSAYRVSRVEVRARPQVALAALALSLALGLGLPFTATPVRATCAFDGAFGGIICTGTSSGCRDPTFTGGKIQVQGGANITHFADTFRVGANNTIDSAGDINASDTGISASGNLIFNNTGTANGRTGVAVSTGDLEMTNTRTVNGQTAITVSGHAQLTNSGTVTGLQALQGNTVALFNTGSISGAFIGVRGTTAILVTNEGTITGSSPGALALDAGTNATILNKGRINGSTRFGLSADITNTGEMFSAANTPAILAGDAASPQPGVTLTLDNSGTIAGAGLVRGIDGATIDITNTGTMTHRGAVFISTAGFALASGTLTITNSGTLKSEALSGALVDADVVTLTNKHRIERCNRQGQNPDGRKLRRCRFHWQERHDFPVHG